MDILERIEVYDCSDGGHSDRAQGSAYDLMRDAAAEVEALRTRLRALIQWHQNWDAPFHEEDEWIEDFRLAREAVGITHARSVQV